jgi:hypothetical protein
MADLADMERLLTDLRTLPKEEKIDEDLFSICGFPHYERVASNVLAFFLDNKREHGLGDLFMQSLLSCGGIAAEGLDLNYEVKKEVQTDKGNFIDLVVESDSFIIIIENKIYASLYNDLEDYYGHYAKARNSNVSPRQIFAFVLSLTKIPPINSKYIFIDYESLFLEIKTRLGETAIRANQRYLSLLFDFITNLENLKRGITMDHEFINFVKEHTNEIDNINTRLKKIHDDFRHVVEAVNSQVLERFQTDKIKQWAWRRLPEFYDTAVTDIFLDNVNIAIDARIDLDGWSFVVFTRKNKNGFDLENYLQTRNMAYTIQSYNKLKLDMHFDINENSMIVADFISGVIEKLLADKA